MTDHATPCLPSRSFDATTEFYAKLGFEKTYRDNGWMILKRGSIALEFFPYPDLNPLESSFMCCVRLNDLASFHAHCRDAGIPETARDMPRLVAPKLQHSGMTIGYLIDPDGTLLHLVQNKG